MADVLFATAFILGGLGAAGVTHRLLCHPYKTALKRIVDAADDPDGRDIAQALDAADELLGRRR